MPYQKVRDVELYYEWHGSKEAEVVVFVNGLFADTTSWSLQRDAFAASYRVLLYDARGQGRSQKPNGPYFHYEHVADLVALLDALGISQASFVGISHGGTVSMRLAAEYPLRVRRLAVANTFAHCDALMQAKLSSWLRALELGGTAARFDISLPWVWGRRFAAEQWGLVEVRERLRPLGDWIIRFLDDDGYLRTPLEEVADRLKFLIGKGNTRATLVISPATTISTTPASAGQVMASPNSSTP